MIEVPVKARESVTSDLILVEETLAGNRRAYEDLYRRHVSRVYTFLVWMTTDEHAAEELTQEVFIRAFRAIRTFRLGRRFLPWLYSIALNELRSSYGRMMRRRGRETAVWDIAAGDTLDPQDAMEHDLVVASVRKAVAELPASLREIVILYYLQEMSVSEVAEVVGLGRENVKSRLHRARRRLRETLEDRAT